MTHPVIDNFRRQYDYRNSIKRETPSQEGVGSFLERINEYIIATHGDELFPDGRTLTSTSETINGHKVVICTRPLKAGWSFNVPEPSQTALLGNFDDEIIGILGDEIAAEIRNIQKQYPATIVPYIFADSYGIRFDPSTFEPVVGFQTVFGVEVDEDHVFVKNSVRASGDGGYVSGFIKEVVERLIACHAPVLFPSGLYMEGPVTLVGETVLTAKSRVLKTVMKLPPIMETHYTPETMHAIRNANIDTIVHEIYTEIKEELDRSPEKIMVPYMIFGHEYDLSIRFKIRYDLVDKNALLKSAYDHIVRSDTQ